MIREMKQYRQNLHTHTTYCDGRDTIEEMIIAACEKGFHSIGFSSHSVMGGRSLSQHIIDDYKREIAVLKNKYADRIEVFCGLECEMRGDVDLSGFDYLIGAIHYFEFENELVSFERELQDAYAIIKQFFGGDGMAFAKFYYQELAKLPQYGSFDIIAHFDLITKYRERESLIDVTAKEYQWAAIEAAEQLAGKIPYFEINTGAMARGYRTSPYPDVFLLKELKRLGFGAIISTDCHDSTYLDYGYSQAVGLLKECGFKEQFVLTKHGFVPIEL